MTILVTRPRPEGEALCHALSAKQIPCVYRPLIEFSKGKGASQLCHAICDAQIVIAVSKPAVEWADKVLRSQAQSWPNTICYVAVGQKTADKLSEVTAQTVHYPEVSDSEHLLQLAPLINVDKTKIVILRGSGGRELIHDVLCQRGAIVNYCEVYQRQPLTFDEKQAVKHWQNNKVTHIVVTSGEQLNYLHTIVPKNEWTWLLEQMLIVPSKRIECLAQTLGFHNVTVSGSASNPDLVAVIEQLCTTGQAHDKQKQQAK